MEWNIIDLPTHTARPQKNSVESPSSRCSGLLPVAYYLRCACYAASSSQPMHCMRWWRLAHDCRIIPTARSR